MTTSMTNPTRSTTRFPTLSHGTLHGVWAWVHELRARRAQSKSLGRLTPRDLKDIGLIDSDVSAANRLPLSQDAATALHLSRLGRSGNW